MPTFQVKARVLDLLGEQQIANCPTAISELFKNSHDAYAERASLDIYPEDDRAILWDDGFGMTESDLLTRWLVVGTAGKQEEDRRPPPPGFATRPIQGEKGIGRLAISTIGDSLLLISKKATSDPYPFTALFINWNIVKNPDLLIGDIEIPVVSFSNLDELDASVAHIMVSEFRASLLRLPEEKWTGASKSALKNKILTQLDDFDYSPIYSKRTGLYKTASGTLLYIRHLKVDLADYVRSPSRDDEEEIPANIEAIQLLSNFRNIFASDNPFQSPAPEYPFKVDMRRWNSEDNSFVSLFEEWQAFTPEGLRVYDHKFDVHFDEEGRATGTMEVYGKTIDLPPASQQQRRVMGCGPFDLHLWYFQGTPSESRLDAEQFTVIERTLKNFGGLMIYRDGLRVLPYGRPEMDWLGFEERRSRKAGKYFFGYRRMFGYVSISSSENSALKDKAGREGLITSAAYRRFRQRLVDFFVEIARRYFYQNAEFEELQSQLKLQTGVVDKQQQRAQDRREKLKRDLGMAIQHMNDSGPALAALVSNNLAKLQALKEPGELEVTEALINFQESLNRLDAAGRVNIPQALSLGRDRQASRLKHDYLESRKEFEASCHDAAEAFGSKVRSLVPAAEAAAARHKILKDALFQAKVRVGRAFSVLETAREEELKKLNKALSTFRYDLISGVTTTLLQETGADSERDALLSPEIEASVILAALSRVSDSGVAMIDEKRDALVNHIQGFFAEHREAVLAAQSDLIEELRDKVDRNLDLVQLGLSVEIIDHELGKLYRSVKVDLQSLSTLVRNFKPGVELAERLRINFQHLEQRYKLMSPLYRGTSRNKANISGLSILKYVQEILQGPADSLGVSISATAAAQAFEVREVASVVLPVFVNLTDNAVYWVRDSPEKRIVFDIRDDVMTVCDTGPGIHETLLDEVFEAFFTTKPNGRGLGLYIAKANLSRYGHEIWATNDPVYRSLCGACICIRFNKESLGAK